MSEYSFHEDVKQMQIISKDNIDSFTAQKDLQHNYGNLMINCFMEMETKFIIRDMVN